MLDTLIGAGVGGATGLMSDMEARKERKRQEKKEERADKRNRFKELQGAIAGYQQTRAAGQSTLAQLAFDMARDVRM